MRNLQLLISRRQRRRLQFGLLMIGLLAGCVSTPPPPVEPSTEKVDTTALEQMAIEGRFLDAALAYSKLAAETPSPQREDYALRTAELLMSGNYVPQAFQLLHEIDATTLDPNLQARHALLSAQIALARQRPDDALIALATVEPMLSDDNLRLRYYPLRAEALTQQGHYQEAAREHVALEPLLTDPLEVLANQEAILSALQALGPEAPQSPRIDAPLDVLSGWIELARISRSVEEAGQSSAELLTWRVRYPQHPALESIIEAVLAARPRALPLPRHIALILPLNTRFAKAASAVRDGFLAAHYAQQSSMSGEVDVPTIRVYDEGDDPAFINLIYEQAIDDGAEFVVGPLSKAAVSRLASHDPLPVPVLALNFSKNRGTTSHTPPPANLFQLGLSPEQEARQVAERAWLDGHQRAAIIIPTTRWGERVAKAFSERWLAFGGHVVEKQAYDAKKSDYSLPIRRLLNVDESERREQELRRLMGRKLEFIPRRRQDVDFIFMAAFSRQARLIRPQLRFHHAAKVPVYAISHSYSGRVNANMDRDMNGVIFADMPWTLSENSPQHALKTEIQRLWPTRAGRHARLYALGVDAYHVIGELNTLRRDHSAFFRGETGDLYLDMANHLQRRLLWARFERGEPQLLDKF
jgi:outer membrane PBP1 activator LpoA protein